ncbi:MAG: hypothetical protein HYZ34_14780 [Ignavibacteriae bacterium]|nr:hypothetical protein [Ignavibacteriota bacterium]
MENTLSSRLCYPDPFKPVAIEFTLQHSAVVTLSISDESGNEIIKLVDTQQHESGIHKIELREGLLSEGLYYYRLQVEFPGKGINGKTESVVTEVRKFKI